MLALQQAAVFIEQFHPEWPVAILLATTLNAAVDEFLERHANNPLKKLASDYLNHTHSIHVSNLVHCKGFEFSAVWIVGLEAENFPSQGVPEGELWREYQRLYVAMTRARDKLTLVYNSDHPPCARVQSLNLP